MNEFKIIPDAKNYKINKNGEVQRMNGSRVFVMADNIVLLKNNDGINEQFEVGKLINELFVENIINATEDILPSDSTMGASENYIHPDPIEENSLSIENEEDANDTNESEDRLLVNQEFVNEVIRKETTCTPIHNNISCHLSEPCEDKKRGRGRPKGSKNMDKKIKPEKESKPMDFKVTKEIQRILDLDEFDRIKICKLHMLGCSVDEIIVHLKKPKKAYATVYVTISQFKKDKKLQERVAGIN